jgi:hypothetical protein
MTTDLIYLGEERTDSDGRTDYTGRDYTNRDYADRMREIQLAFIDDPRKAALDAGGLVSEVLQSLADELAQRRKELAAKSGDGAAPDTEQLRQSVRRYRELLDTLTRAASAQAAGSAQAQALERPEETTYRVGENGDEPEAIDRDAMDPADVSWPSEISEHTEILERR